MGSDQARELAGKERACLVAPAGYGKTEVIAKSVAFHTQTRQLILTHTHAGVRALRARLTRFGATYENFRLDTIAGFALRYAISFPKLSGLPTITPTTSQDWNAIYAGAERLFRHPGISGVIRRSFGGLYVDEYQDCSPLQHTLIMALAELMPCRVVGDSLQGIFDFSDPIVDWEQDVFPNFERIADLTTPWRWAGSNPELGAWLDGTREKLQRGEGIDLDHDVLDWVNSVELPNQISKCKDFATASSVVGIRQWAQHCHALAKLLGGTFNSMEEVESKDLMSWASKVDGATGAKRALVLIDFATKCMTGVAPQLSPFKKKFAVGTIPDPGKVKKNRAVLDALIEAATTTSITPCINVVDAVNEMEKCSLYRTELWNEMRNTFTTALSGPEDEGLRETAWKVRDKGRRKGRRVDKRVISRPLLIKGLEFDHAIVLDATELSKRNLYVAMTRGSKTLTIHSPNQVLNPVE